MCQRKLVKPTHAATALERCQRLTTNLHQTGALWPQRYCHDTYVDILRVKNYLTKSLSVKDLFLIVHYTTQRKFFKF